MSHTTEWEGLAWPEQRRPQPKVPGPLEGGKASHGRRKVTVHMYHNDHFPSGNVRFELPNWLADAEHQHHAGPNQEGMVSVHIPFDAMLQLVLEYYRGLSLIHISEPTRH